MASSPTCSKVDIRTATFAVLTEMTSGEPYGVNWSHVESISVDDAGTLIAFASGDTVTVRESFAEVLAATKGAHE